MSQSEISEPPSRKSRRGPLIATGVLLLLAGAGTTALVLRRRGHEVAENTRGQIAHTLADSETTLDASPFSGPVVGGGDSGKSEKERVFGETRNPPENFGKKLNWLKIWYEKLPETAIWPKIVIEDRDGKKREIVEMDRDFDYARKQFKKQLQEIIDTVLLDNPSDRAEHITQMNNKLGIDTTRLADLVDEIYAEEIANLKETEGEFAAAEKKAREQGRDFSWENRQLAREKERTERIRRFATCVRNDQCDPYLSGVGEE